jgi:hypothetical protein
VRCVALPGWLLDLERRALSLISPTAGNLVAFLWAFGTHSVVPDGREARRIFGVPPLTADAFLRAKRAPAPSTVSVASPHPAPALVGAGR